MDGINALIAGYQEFLSANPWIAPLAAFFLPVVEALLPWLPLSSFVVINLGAMAIAYGPVAGTLATILLSAAGSFAGMFAIFLLIRLALGRRFARRIEASAFGRRFVDVAAGGNTGMILSLMCNPLLPGSIMNYVLAFTRIKVPRYLFLTGVSRIVVMVTIVLLGTVFNIQEHPLNVLWVFLLYAVLFAIGWLYKKIIASRQRASR